MSDPSCSTQSLMLSVITLLLLLLKKIGSERLKESDIHPICSETPAPQYQKIDRKKRKGKIAEDYIIIIIIILESAVQGWERVRTFYQSKDPNPTQPTHGRKKKIKQ